MKELLGEEWYKILKDEFTKPYMINLAKFITSTRTNTIVYPKSEDVFNAYKYTPYSKVRVCIIGQDPYIAENQAHGIAFSTENSSYTPSLRNIEYALMQDGELTKDFGWDNNLTRWTEQGVMLLNTILTVYKGLSNSHVGKGWEEFTLKTIYELDNKGNVIFLLWGKLAQEFKLHIVNPTSIVMSCEHPVVGSYQNRVWKNDNCFSKVNEILEPKVNW